MNSIRRAFLAGLAALALAACGQPSSGTRNAENEPLKIYAAASLADVLPPIADAFAAETNAPKPVLVFASSAELARQIEQGADADIFISADEAWMDYLDARNLIDVSTRKPLLTNRLVLVAPADQPFALELQPGVDLAGALGNGRLAMGDPESVPAGRYAREALQSLGAWEAVEPRVVRGQNVRDALRFVESGDAAAGVVYATDAKAAGDRVVVIAVFAPETHTPITYPAAIIAGRTEQAAQLLARLESVASREWFAEAGFGAP